MNEIEEENIIFLSQSYKHICVDINIFTDLIKVANDPRYKFEPITVLEIIKKGLYAQLGSACCWVSKLVPQYHIRVSNEDIISNKDPKWSLSLLLTTDPDKFEKLFNLKAFW